MGRGELADLLAQAIFYTFLVALAVEALLRLWRVGDAALRLWFRLLPLALPVAVIAFFEVVAPGRHDDAFREHWALFVGRRWADVRLLGIDLFTLWLGGLALAGVLLFLRDLVPLVHEILVRRGPPPRHRGDLESALTEVVHELAPRLGVRPPAVVVVARQAPVLLCSGGLRPRIVLSPATTELLDPEELRAAVAHELAHVRRRDPLVGWVLMAARAVMLFNPVFQVAARLVSREAEWRADDDASRATGARLALAGGILDLYRASLPPGRHSRPGWLSSLEAPLARAGTEAIARRCRRLIDGPGTPLLLGRTRLGLTALSLAVLLYFVV